MTSSFRHVAACRICGNTRLMPVVDLGEQALTGVFPRTRDEPITRGPLRLVKCDGETPHSCGLLQLADSYDMGEMYGENYGYRSSLNASMVAHLREKVARILALVSLQHGDLVVDIGSNDATTLKAYPDVGYRLVGVDPTGEKFRSFYPAHIELIPEFFSAELVRQRCGARKAKVVTSIAMFYDLESPLDFMRDVREILHDEGVWVFEQSYMPAMLETNSYDTICQEHLEYYGLEQIRWMTEKVGLKILEIEFNAVNGGSFSVTVAKHDAQFEEAPDLARLLARERVMKLSDAQTYRDFAARVATARDELTSFLSNARRARKRVCGLGASTKGNVILQYCGVTSRDIESVGEVNSDKYGCWTPGTGIPILSEEQVLASRPDYLLVLPWHFREFFLNSPKFKAFTLVFPLPRLEVVPPRS